jgi:hypothetical protein
LTDINVDITADPSGYRRGADEAKKITRDLTEEFSASNKTLSALGGIAATGGKLVAAGLGVAALGALAATRNIITTADAMADLSKKTGLSAEQLGAWKLATEQSDTSLEGLAGGLKNVAKYMVEHNDNLAKLGITGKTSEDVLIQLAGVLSSMSDEDPRKMALANEVLGRSYQGLMPLLAEGEEGLRKLLERGRELNPVTSELAAQSDLFNDQLAELRLSAGGLGASLASTLLPHLNDILASMRAAARESGLLSAVWAGMKGLAAHAFGVDDISKARDRLEEVKRELTEINVFLSGDMATAAHTQALIPRLKALGIEKAELESRLNPTPPVTAVKPPSDAALESILKPGRKTGTKKTSSSGVGDSAYLDEIRDIAQLIKEVSELTEGEKSHLQVLQDKVNAYVHLDPAVKTYLQTTIDQANQVERAKAFEESSRKLLEENQNLNVDLIQSDKERVLAQLALEHQRSLDRISGMKLESDQVQALIDQETQNYELRMKKAQQSVQQGTEKTSDLVKSLGLQFTSAFENAIAGGQKFTDVLLGLERDVERMLARQLVTKPILGMLEKVTDSFLGSFLSGLFGGGATGKAGITGGGLTGFAAKGAWFDGAMSYFADGGIIDRVTPFLFGNGGRLGVAGEAGPEGIFPLKRGANGQLGVQGTGASVNVQVNLIESPGNGGQTQQRQDENGNLTMDIMVEQIEGKMGRNIMRGNGLAPVLEGKYGLNPAAGVMR